MDLTFTRDQEQIRQAFGDLFEAESTTRRVRAAEAAGGFDPELWARAKDVGLLDMATTPGADGASTLDLALVAEEAGRHLASIPAVEAMVAARLLAELAGEGLAGEGLAGEGLAGEGMSQQADRVHDELVSFTPRPVQAGLARVVPGGAVADAVIALAGDRLVLLDRPGSAVRAPSGTLGGAPVADWTVGAAARTLARGPAALDRFRRARRAWLALSAAALAGLGTSAVQLGADYAKQRKAFGVVISMFQGVSHRLVDAAVGIDGAELLSWEAAWSLDQPGPSDWLPLTAFYKAGLAAEEAASVSLHVHGGYGVSMEYDIQLYLRRAKTWALALGDRRRVLRQAADVLYGPAS